MTNMELMLDCMHMVSRHMGRAIDIRIEARELFFELTGRPYLTTDLSATVIPPNKTTRTKE